MAERNPIPTESDALNWASDGTTYSSSDPGAPKRLVGFQPKDEPVPGPGEVIPAGDHNWLWKKGMEFLTWLKDGATRQWYDISNGIADGTIYDVFRVVPPTGSLMWGRYTQKWNVAGTAAAGGNPTQIRTDGEQIYYLAGSVNQTLVAANPIDGSEIWENGAGITQFASLATDGAAVYVTSTNIGEPGLHVRDRTDGSNTATAGAEYNCSLLVANGVYCCGVNGLIGGAGSLVFYTVATPVETGTVTPLAAAILGLAIDADTVYVAGTRNTDDVFAYTLSTRALLWSVTLDTNDPSPINCIAADGEYVYVGCDVFATASIGNRSLFCLNRTTGAVVWSLDFFDVIFLAVDDRYIHVIVTGGNLYMFRKDAPEQGPVAVAADVNDIDCDGISVVCADLTTPANFQRNMVGLPAKEFMIAAGTDPNRRPFFNLAVPMDS